ncbi:MAG: dehydrogenase [Telmatospirillum sp.]|nr:dehydrogenase [Telmatospirillum sp.]
MRRPLRIVASGDYLHTIGRDAPADLGFGVFDPARFDLALLPAAPQTEAVPASALANADVLLMLGQYLPEASIATAAATLTVVARAGVGIDKIDVDALTRHGILLFNVPDALTQGTAAGALALMLAASRHIVAMDRLTREGRWDDRQYHRGREIYGKTLGVIGPGRIGAELVRLVAPFGMRCLAYSPRLTQERAQRMGAEAVLLDRLLQESHFVVICAPLTDETRGMVGARELGLMRRDGVLVNVGRGPIIDQTALAHALAERRIAAAALDVFDPQPFAADDLLARLDNVVLSPHAICDTYELRTDVLAAIARELSAFAEGALPSNCVNPAVVESARFQAKRTRLIQAMQRS